MCLRLGLIRSSGPKTGRNNAAKVRGKGNKNQVEIQSAQKAVNHSLEIPPGTLRNLCFNHATYTLHKQRMMCLF